MHENVNPCTNKNERRRSNQQRKDATEKDVEHKNACQSMKRQTNNQQKQDWNNRTSNQSARNDAPEVIDKPRTKHVTPISKGMTWGTKTNKKRHEAQTVTWKSMYANWKINALTNTIMSWIKCTRIENQCTNRDLKNYQCTPLQSAKERREWKMTIKKRHENNQMRKSKTDGQNHLGKSQF